MSAAPGGAAPRTGQEPGDHYRRRHRPDCAAFLLPQTERKPWPELIDLAIVGGFAGLVAYGELVSRYRDRPGQLIAAPPTPLYLLINIAAGVAALLLVNKFQVVAETKAPRLYALLLAGFGSIAFFRSSFFTVRIGGSDIGIGPSAFPAAIASRGGRPDDRPRSGARSGYRRRRHHAARRFQQGMGGAAANPCAFCSSSTLRRRTRRASATRSRAWRRPRTSGSN